VIAPHERTRFAVSPLGEVYAVHGIAAETIQAPQAISASRRFSVPRRGNDLDPIYYWGPPRLVPSSDLIFMPALDQVQVYLDNFNA
jgi:hypothetical protein